MSDFQNARDGGGQTTTVKPPLPHLEQQQQQQEAPPLADSHLENQLQVAEQKQPQANVRNEQLPPCSDAFTCSGCLTIGKTSEGLSFCYWDGNACIVAKPGDALFQCPPVYYDTTTTENLMIPSSSQDDTASNATAAMWLEKAFESGIGHALIVLVFLAGLFFLRRKGLLTCTRGGKGSNVKYEALNNSSPSSSSRDLGGLGIQTSLQGTQNMVTSNKFASETIPLSSQSLSSADEEWGWEEGEPHVEMAGMPKSYNFPVRAVTASLPRVGEEEDSRLPPPISGLDQRSGTPFSNNNNSINGLLSFTADNLSSSLAASGIPTHITSLGPKVSVNNTSNINKPKPMKQEDDIFATLGLSVKPTFGSASSSVASLPKHQQNNKLAFTSPSPVSYELNSSLGSQRSVGNIKNTESVKTYNQEADNRSYHSSGAAAEWGEDDDLDDLLND